MQQGCCCNGCTTSSHMHLVFQSLGVGIEKMKFILEALSSFIGISKTFLLGP